MTKTALVTGGSRGIGFGISMALAKIGYNVVINGTREASLVKDKIATLASFGTKVIYIQGNIAERNSREEIFNQVRQLDQQINLLVNNAGVAPRVRKDMLDLDESDYDYVMDINLKGTFFIAQQFARWMLEWRQVHQDYTGMIINISSVSAIAASVKRGEYCISKAGISMMSKLLAIRLAEANIPVYEIRPGVINTDMIAKVKTQYQKLIDDGLTLENRMGTVEDIGTIVATMAQGGMPYATGQIITPDGGMMIERL